MTWDAIIVGAGPAGAAAAYDLARAGRRVLLVDKAEFPRPKACAGGLTMRAVRALRYPVDPVVRRVACEIVLESDGSGPPVSRALPVRRRNPLCLMTVREELDAYCLARTLEAGAVLQRIPSIDSINATDCRVTLTLAGGAVLEARTLIAADGVHSRVRTLLDPGASWHRKGFAIEANVALDGNFAPPLTFDFAPVPGGYGWLFPRHDHVNIGLYVHDASIAHTLNRTALEDYAEARCGTRAVYGLTGQFLGNGAESAPAEALPANVLLVGDAGGFSDPLTGEGIYGAIASGQAAAAAVLASAEKGDSPALAFAQRTRRLRRDLAVAAGAARGFYREPARAFTLLRYAPVRQAAIQTFSHGSSITVLAAGARTLSRLLPRV